MLERDIEKPSKEKARRAGWFVRKYKSPGNRSAPDDLFAKCSRIFFTEFKATGKTPTPLQADEHRQMREAGLTVYWTDSRDGFLWILDREETALKEHLRTRPGMGVTGDYPNLVFHDV